MQETRYLSEKDTIKLCYKIGKFSIHGINESAKKPLEYGVIGVLVYFDDTYYIIDTRGNRYMLLKPDTAGWCNCVHSFKACQTNPLQKEFNDVIEMSKKYQKALVKKRAVITQTNLMSTQFRDCINVLVQENTNLNLSIEDWLQACKNNVDVQSIENETLQFSDVQVALVPVLEGLNKSATAIDCFKCGDIKLKSIKEKDGVFILNIETKIRIEDNLYTNKIRNTRLVKGKTVHTLKMDQASVSTQDNIIRTFNSMYIGYKVAIAYNKTIRQDVKLCYRDGQLCYLHIWELRIDNNDDVQNILRYISTQNM